MIRTLRDYLSFSKRQLDLEKEKEQTMAKKKVVQFTVTDGKTPGRREADESGRPFLLRSPLDLSFRGRKEIKLGLSCNLPVLVIRGDATQFFAPGQELRVTIDTGAGDANFSRGETIAQGFVLDNTDLELTDA